MIGIVDYGMGNLFWVSKGLERLEAESFISDNPEELAKADGNILPGVGSFRDAMCAFRGKGFRLICKTICSRRWLFIRNLPWYAAVV